MNNPTWNIWPVAWMFCLLLQRQFLPFLPYSVPQKTTVLGNHQQAPYPLTSRWASVGTWVGEERGWRVFMPGSLPIGSPKVGCILFQKVGVPVLSLQFFSLCFGNCSLLSLLGPGMRKDKSAKPSWVLSPKPACIIVNSPLSMPSSITKLWCAIFS